MGIRRVRNKPEVRTSATTVGISPARNTFMLILFFTVGVQYVAFHIVLCLVVDFWICLVGFVIVIAVSKKGDKAFLLMQWLGPCYLLACYFSILYSEPSYPLRGALASTE